MTTDSGTPLSEFLATSWTWAEQARCSSSLGKLNEIRIRHDHRLRHTPQRILGNFHRDLWLPGPGLVAVDQVSIDLGHFQNLGYALQWPLFAWFIATCGCLALGWWQWTRFQSTSGTFKIWVTRCSGRSEHADRRGEYSAGGYPAATVICGIPADVRDHRRQCCAADPSTQTAAVNIPLAGTLRRP